MQPIKNPQNIGKEARSHWEKSVTLSMELVGMRLSISVNGLGEKGEGNFDYLPRLNGRRLLVELMVVSFLGEMNGMKQNVTPLKVALTQLILLVNTLLGEIAHMV
jgi:hypothetical protein